MRSAKTFVLMGLVVVAVLVLSRKHSAAQDDPREPVRVEGYVETNYTYAFSKPANRVIAQRAFDNRHNTFSLSNAVLGVSLQQGPVFGRLAFQLGVTPATYYQAEPSFAAEGGVAAVNADLWRYLQEAYGGMRVPGLAALRVDAGLFLSQIGLEPLAIRDAWNWSRSNLFFGLPFYHTGVRVHAQLSPHWNATAALYNGWNSVIDNNTNKSLSFRLAYATDCAEAAVLYFGGVERDADDPQGQPWRHLFDAWARVSVLPYLDVAAHANAGFEHIPEGTLDWYAGAAFARFSPSPHLSVASRTDIFFEHAPTDSLGKRAAIFWDVQRLLSQTTTLSWWGHPRVRWLLEHRYDNASGPLFFKATSPTPNAKHQHTVTVGLVVVL